MSSFLICDCERTYRITHAFKERAIQWHQRRHQLAEIDHVKEMAHAAGAGRVSGPAF